MVRGRLIALSIGDRGGDLEDSPPCQWQWVRLHEFESLVYEGVRPCNMTVPKRDVRLRPPRQRLPCALSSTLSRSMKAFGTLARLLPMFFSHRKLSSRELQ